MSEPADLATSVQGTQPSLVFGPESPLYERCVTERDCIRLVTYPEGAEVAAELRFPEPGYGDLARRVVLVPTHELSAQWYALEANVDGRVGEMAWDERTQLARFRPDSHPIVTHLLVGRRRDETGATEAVVEVRFSERIAGDVPASRWTLADESGHLACDVLGPEGDRREHHAVFLCERLPEGRTQLDFGGSLQTLLGTELVDEGNRALTSVEVDVPRVEGEHVERVPVFAWPSREYR